MKFLLYIFTTIMPIMVYPQTNSVINGTASLLKDGTEISLQAMAPVRLQNSNKKITTSVKDHRFEFVLNNDGEQLYYLSSNKGGSKIFLKVGKVNIIIVDSIAKQVTVPGNLTDFEYKEYEKQLIRDTVYKIYVKSVRDYYRYKNKTTDTVLINTKKQKMDSLRIASDKAASNISLNWINLHPDSYINTKILFDQLGYIAEDEVEKVFQSMPTQITDNVWGKEIRYQIDSLFIGGTAPDFSQADTNGKKVNLASFRGKYVLLDFWASWCIPCREENPAIVNAMAKFKNRNFTIVSISFDEKKDAWLNAIKQDGLNWTHLSELKAWENTPRFKYYITSIPGNYLIDPNGKIIAKNLRGAELDKVLSKLLK